MSFKIWDNHFGGYMVDADEGRVAEFNAKIDADRAIERFVRPRDRQDEWLFRLDVEHAASNLCYHLDPISHGDECVQHRPLLRPIDYRVPKSNWKLFAGDGGELTVGITVRTWRDQEEFELIGLAPPHKFSSSVEVTCLDRRGRKNWWYPRVIGASYKYAPPEETLDAATLHWASAEKWEPPVPIDIPPARRIALPRPIWETPREESTSIYTTR
jgi:hypothetical protein